MQIFTFARIGGWGELVITGLSETCQGSLSGRLWAAAGSAFSWVCSEVRTCLHSSAVNFQLVRDREEPNSLEAAECQDNFRAKRNLRWNCKSEKVEAQTGSKPIWAEEAVDSGDMKAQSLLVLMTAWAACSQKDISTPGWEDPPRPWSHTRGAQLLPDCSSVHPAIAT